MVMEIYTERLETRHAIVFIDIIVELNLSAVCFSFSCILVKFIFSYTFKAFGYIIFLKGEFKG